MGGNQSSITGITRGYHVLKVLSTILLLCAAPASSTTRRHQVESSTQVVPASPADIAGLDPYFDYIQAINRELLDEENSSLITILTQNVDKEVLLHVYSAKYQDVREVTLIPSRSWGKPEDGVIGCSVRFCDYAGSGENVWHILDVYANSPAEKAGLKPHSDYIIGSPQATLKEQQDLYDLVERSFGQPLQLLVYNKDVDSVREVLLVPNDDWGGPGIVGCDIGYGYIHRIPTIQRSSLAPKSYIDTHSHSPDPIPHLPRESREKTRDTSSSPFQQHRPFSEADKSEPQQPDENTHKVHMGGFQNVNLMPTQPHSPSHDQQTKQPLPPQQNPSQPATSSSSPKPPASNLNAMSLSDTDSGTDSSNLEPPPPPPTGGFVKAHAPNIRMGSGLRYGGGTIRGIEGSLGLHPDESGGHDHIHDAHDHSHDNAASQSGHEHSHDTGYGGHAHDHSHGHSHD